MKSIFRMVGIIALVAVIGMAMIACSGKKDGTGGSSSAGEKRKTAGELLSYKYGTWVKDDDSSTSLAFEQISGQRISTFIFKNEKIIFQTYNANGDQIKIHVGPGFDDQIVVEAEFNEDGSKMYVTSVAYTGVNEGTRDFSTANGTYSLVETDAN